MPIQFHCEYCQQLIRVPVESAGHQARCPFCRNVQSVPDSAVPDGLGSMEQDSTSTESPYLNPSFDDLRPVTPPVPPPTSAGVNPPSTSSSGSTSSPDMPGVSRSGNSQPGKQPPPYPNVPPSVAAPTASSGSSSGTPTGSTQPPIANPYREPPQNPYAAVTEYATADVSRQMNLASPGDRFLGVVIDMLFALVCVIPGFTLAIIADSSGSPALEQVAAALFCIGLLAYAGTQWTLIAKRAQSVGKIVMKTRIVTQSGAAPGFMHGVVLRIWLFRLACLPFSCFCGPAILMVSIVDGLMVLGDRRQTLHDMLASTFVVSDRE